MIKRVNEFEFVDAFKDENGNIDRQHGFTYEGLMALWDYLNEYEESMDEEMQLDPVGLRCDFTEYEHPMDIVDEYNLMDDDDREDYDDLEDEDDKVIFLMDLIEYHTMAILLDNGGVLIHNF